MTQYVTVKELEQKLLSGEEIVLSQEAYAIFDRELVKHNIKLNLVTREVRGQYQINLKKYDWN